MKSGGFFKKFGVCALSAALCVSAFSACGKTDGDKIDGNTDVSDVKSEQVKDEAAWKAAFDVSKFTNFTMKTEETRTTGGQSSQEKIVYKYAGNKVYYSTFTKNGNGNDEQHDVYFAKSNDVWAAYGVNFENGAKTTESAYDMADHSEFEYIVSGDMGITPVSRLAQTIAFDKVTYDESAKGYLYEAEGQGTATIKIAGGLFAGYIMTTATGEGDAKTSLETKVSYYDIGTTAITLPDGMTNNGGDNAGDNTGDNTGNDNQPGVVLTADTDFAALESDRVNAAGWAKAFNAASYKNFTAYAYYATPDFYAVQKTTDGMGFFGVVGDDSMDMYVYKDENEKYMGISDGQVVEWPLTSETYMRDGLPLMMNYSCMCPNFAAFFADFTYDETKKSYVYEGAGLETNDYFGTGGGKAVFVKAELKIVNGLVAYVSVEDSGGNKENTKFYDFGATAITLPTSGDTDEGEQPRVVLTADTDFDALKSEKVDEAGWRKAFNYASYKNFTSYTAYRTTKSYAVQKATEAGGYYNIGSFELYCYIGADGAYKMSNGKTELACASVYMRNGIPITMNYSCMCPDFSDDFWKFSYKSGVYEYKGGIKTNAYFGEGDYSTYSSVQLKIVNGLLAYIDVKNDGQPDNRKTTKFYDFGTTEVTLPVFEK